MARGYGADYFPQYAELDKINWEELSQQCGLPFTAYDHQTHSFQNKIGTKGATVASAIMRIINMEQGEIFSQEQMLFFTIQIL